jgi:hypothetical protein
MSLDTTIGGASADSYNSVSEADTRFGGDIFFADTWAALTTTQKEKWLRFSTRSLDLIDQWRGVRQSDTQALEYPRIDYSPHLKSAYQIYKHLREHPLQRIFEPNTIPDKIKEAQYQMLIFLYNNKTDSSALDGSEIQELEALNKLVVIKYDSTRKDSRIDATGQGSLSTVKALIAEYVLSTRWHRS